MFYEDRSVIATEHKHTDESHLVVIAHPVGQWWNCKMIVFYALSYFQFMKVNKGTRIDLRKAYLWDEKHKPTGEHSVDLRVN